MGLCAQTGQDEHYGMAMTLDCCIQTISALLFKTDQCCSGNLHRNRTCWMYASFTDDIEKHGGFLMGINTWDRLVGYITPAAGEIGQC